MALERPCLTLRIGITGHRRLDAPEFCRAGIRDALTLVRRVTERIHVESRAAWDPNEPRLRAVSALAEGADQLFAAEAIELGFELDCPLPFPCEEYERDFKSPESLGEFRRLLERADGQVLELDGPTAQEHRSAAYESVGRILLDQCDVLLAVWDGEAARGPSGTAQIVELARRRGIPCLWIHAQTGAALLKMRSHERPLDEAALADALGRILRPPISRDPDVTGSYRAKIAEKASLLSQFWTQFQRAMTFGLKPSAGYREAPLEGPFVASYRHFDALANREAGLYRGSFLASSVLGVCAVFLALFGFVLPKASEIWLAIELAAVLLV